MSTNGDNITEDAEMAECDGDKVVTMMDVLQEQQEFEEDANAVLGASDDKNCTYSKGYIKRQAIYACLTCCMEAKEDPTKRAGVCLACSLTCHENHELVELYTKRNFRCDCGNPKFNSHPCQFTPTKTDFNEDNSYNQNFSGLYCVCHRPYPDPEATFEDDMIQCIICEDWLHSSHLEATVPSNELYSEMICKGCMEQNEFLHDYTSLAVNSETDDVDIVMIDGNDAVCNGDKNKLTDYEVATGRNEEVTNDIDVQMFGDKVNNSAEPSENSQAKSVEAKSEAVNEKENTDELEINDQKSENEDTKETINNIDSTIQDKEQEVSNTEIGIAQPDNETSETEIVSDNKNTNFDSEKQNTEQTVEKISTEEDKPVAQKEGELPIDDQTQKSNNNNETTDINVTNPIDDINGGNENSNEKPENCKELETIEEHEREKVTSEQSIEEIITSNEQEIPKAENVMDNSESTKESSEKSADQQLLDDLNELTSDKQDLDETNLQQDTNIEDKGEASNTQITKESEQNTDDSDKSSKDQNVPVNENSEIKEPMEVSENTGISEAMETDTNKNGVTQNTEIANITQSGQTEKDNNITDAVMSAIDEILEEGSEAKCDSAEENSSMTEGSIVKDDKVNDNSIGTDKLNEIDIHEENKKPSNVPEQTESEDNKVTEDFEMRDQNESKDIKNKDESDNKDGDKETFETSKSDSNMTENNVENESGVDVSKPSEAINEELKATVDENSITKDSGMIQTEQSKNVTNNTENSIKEMPTSTEMEETSDKNDNANINASTDNVKVSILTENTNENKRKCDTELPDTSAKKAKLGEGKSCIRPTNAKRVCKGATFWPSNFRQKLCTCGECISMYKDLNVLFLTDIEDTVTAYECLGKENIGVSQYEQGLEALSSLDRIQQINALTEYNKMRDKLLDFLKSFKDRKEIVKEEDIKAFFAGMKPKREPDGVYFCR